MNEVTAAALEFLAMAARARLGEMRAAAAEARVQELETEIEKLKKAAEPVAPKPEGA